MGNPLSPGPEKAEERESSPTPSTLAREPRPSDAYPKHDLPGPAPRQPEHRKQLDQQREEIRTLRNRLHERGEQLAAAEEKVSRQSRALEELASRLDAREQAIDAINRSLSWKLTAPLRVCRRLLSPLLRPLKDLLFGTTFRPALTPAVELVRLPELGAQAWRSTGRDPQFSVLGPWPAGPVRAILHLETDPGVPSRARLYVDRGKGFSEADSYDLGPAGTEFRGDISLDRNTTALRLDPLEHPEVFRIRRFELRSVRALERAFRRVFGWCSRPFRRVRNALRWRSRALLERLRPAAPERRPERLPSGFTLPAPADRYQTWLQLNEWNPRRERVLRDRLSALKERPLLSIVMPVYNPPIPFLVQAYESILGQVYEQWELCIADDASTDPDVRKTLLAWQARDPRVRVLFREQNGNISRATNSAAELARGDYLVFMDQDDELTPDALGEIVLGLAENPGTDLLYSDDDKVDASGRRFAPQFKPDWSPELLLSYMYLSHVLVMKRALFNVLGGLRVGFEGSQDYDLALRAAEKAGRVVHLPKVLYHWRVLPNSTASSGAAKPESFEAGRRAVQEALERRGSPGSAYQPPWALDAGCGIFSHRFPHEGPSVAILIPTRNHLDVLRPCIQSIEARTKYRNYSIVIVNNSSDDPETLEYFRTTPHRVLNIESPGGKFSFAAVMNEAVRRVDHECVLFLNNDTEVRTPDWLSQMMGTLGLPGVGGVGARLLFPDGRIQHAGIVHGFYKGMAGPAFKLHPGGDAGYLSYANVLRNYAAVTAACLLTRREEFLKLGAFDEETFAVAYNDVDFCYRMEAKGRRIAYCPTAELTHHEGYSRGKKDAPREILGFRQKYAGRRDPYYNPHLSLDHERFDVRCGTVAPRTLPPVRTLLCAFNLNWEGAPYSQYEMTVRLKEDGVLDPVVYCPTDGPLRRAYEEKGIAVHILPHPLTNVSTLQNYEAAIRAFAGRFRDWNVEVVYGNTLKTFYAISAAREAGLPSVWNPRESEPWETYFDDFPAPIAARALECFQYPYRVVFVSDATRRNCEPLNSRHNFTTIHNGLNLARIREARRVTSRESARRKLEVRDGTLMILLLGTVCGRKGQMDLVEALKLLDRSDLERIQCFIVGDRPSPYSQSLHAAANALPEPARRALRILPETPEPFPYFSAADLFLCSSRIESFPRVILEAMAFGLPIVTTPVFGIAEQVQEDVNALFYAPGDAATLAARLTLLIRNPTLRTAFGSNSIPVLEGLTDFDQMAAAYGDVFREAWLTQRGRSCAASSV